MCWKACIISNPVQCTAAVQIAEQNPHLPQSYSTQARDATPVPSGPAGISQEAAKDNYDITDSDEEDILDMTPVPENIQERS